MSRRNWRSGFIALSLLLLAHPAAADEMTLAVPARKASPVPPSLQVLANGYELAPLAVCPEVEPNESTAQATVMTLPASCSGNVSSTDAFAIRVNFPDGSGDNIEDVFVLTLATSMRLQLDLTWSSPTADLDLFMFRRNSSGQLVRVDDSLTIGSIAEGLVTTTLSPDTYYIGVSSFSGATAYGLAVSQFTTSGSCVENDNTICLSKNRFRVSATFQTGNTSGTAGAVRLTGDTGYFWFFSNTNVELVLKVLDACGFNNRFWVFAGGLTDVQTTITITDTQTGATKQYTSTGGIAFVPLQDTDAFATCSGQLCTYGVSPTPQQFTSAAGSGTLNVTSQTGCTWTATKSGDFITLTSGTSGSGNGTVGFSVAANTSTSARSGTIAVGGQVATINQSGQSLTCNYTFTPPSANYTNASATGSVNVAPSDAACSWTATSNATWITVTSGNSGTGNGTVGYSIAANPSTSLRTGSISIGGKLFLIEQSGSSTCTYSVSPTSQTVGFAAGGGGTINVTTQGGCNWNATTTTPWITINNGSGTGSGSFTYTVAQNEGTSSRSGSISVATRTVSITQNGDTSKCTYNPPYTSRNFTWCGADSSYQMQTQSGCPWTITSDVPWITPVIENRSGQVAATYIVDRNDTGASRTGMLTAGSFTATITQDPKGAQGTYDGLWTGKTNGNRDVNICVANNALQKVDIRVSLNLITATCTTPLISRQPMNINGTSFTGPVGTYPEVSNITSTLTGSLGSPTAMSGSWTSYSGSYVVFCGSSVFIGFGGTALASGNYTATKQP